MTTAMAVGEAGGSLLVSPRRPGKPPLHLWVLSAAILSTLCAGSLLGAVNLWLIDTASRVVPETWIQAHAWLQSFAFAALLVVGVASFVLPRFWESPAPRAGAVRAAAAGIALGAALAPAGLLALPAAAGRVALLVAAPLLAGGSGLFLAVVVALFRSRRRDRPGLERYLLAGTGWLAVGGTLSAVNAVRTALEGRPALRAALTEPAWAALLYGFVGSWVVGVGLRIVVGPSAKRAARWFFAFELGVLALVAAAFVPGDHGLVARGAGRLLFGLAGIGLAAEPGLVRRRFPAVVLVGERRKERLQRTAWACLALHGVLLCWVGAVELGGSVPHLLVLDAARHLYALGFFVMMALAMASRIFPRLGGNHIERPALLTWAWALLVTALAARLLQVPVALGYPALLAGVAASGPLALAGLVLGFGGLLPALRVPRPAEASDAA